MNKPLDWDNQLEVTHFKDEIKNKFVCYDQNTRPTFEITDDGRGLYCDELKELQGFASGIRQIVAGKISDYSITYFSTMMEFIENLMYITYEDASTRDFRMVEGYKRFVSVLETIIRLTELQDDSTVNKVLNRLKKINIKNLKFAEA